MVIGVPWMGFGLITVFHRGIREGRAGTGITIFTGVLLVVVGVMAILGVGVE
jgi:hypothetical protein